MAASIRGSTAAAYSASNPPSPTPITPIGKSTCLAPIELFELIDGSFYFLNFIANDVPAHLKRLAIDEFAVRLVGVRNQRVAGIRVVSADERRHDHLNAVCCQPAGDRMVISYSGRHSREHFRRPIGIWKCDHSRDRRPRAAEATALRP